jgi:hypothetical protein
MPKHDEYKEIARAALAARVLAMAERWFRRADQLDYVVRRWLMPIPFGEGGPIDAIQRGFHSARRTIE